MLAEVDLDIQGDWDNVGNEGNFPRERGKRRKRSLSAQIIIKPGVVIYGYGRAPLAGSTAPPASVLCTPETRRWGSSEASTPARPVSRGQSPLCAGPDVFYLG